MIVAFDAAILRLAVQRPRSIGHALTRCRPSAASEASDRSLLHMSMIRSFAQPERSGIARPVTAQEC